jgi:hypothetical protein
MFIHGVGQRQSSKVQLYILTQMRGEHKTNKK